MKKLIFVYGTLKRGFSNNFILEKAKFISTATTIEKYQIYPVIGNAYPFLIKSEKQNFIKGEVFEVIEQETLDSLDVLEGYPDLYLKENIFVNLENGMKVEVLTYFKNEETNKDIIDKSKSYIEWLI